MTQTAPQTETLVGTWDADTNHSTVEFVTRYLMTTKVRGAFAEWTGTLVTGDTPEQATVEAHLQTASISTRNDQRDAHLKSADFFEVEKFPTIDFVSTKVSALDSANNFSVSGDLTMHGVTKPVTLKAEWLGNAKDLWGNTRTTFSATTEIDREDWGLTWNAALETGGVLVSKKVSIDFELQFVLRKDEAAAQA